MRDFFEKNWLKILITIAVLSVIVCLISQCVAVVKRNNEIERLENNVLALNDTLRNYHENGCTIAEMRALRLKASELADSLKLERDKKPNTIIRYIIKGGDTITLPVTVTEYDTVYTYLRTGDIRCSQHNEFGKSSRDISVTMPYAISEDGHLCADSMSVVMSQNIWISSALYKDKDGYSHIQLKTDYPNMTFNDGTGILVENGNEYIKKERKVFGVGIGIQVGYGLNYNNHGFGAGPYIGIGLGLNYTPRFLQW